MIKMTELLLSIYKSFSNHKRHIIYVLVVSSIQFFLLLWYLNYKPRTESLDHIVESIDKINIRTDKIYTLITVLSKNDSIMDNQLRHYPAAQPIPSLEIQNVSSVFSERTDPITGEKKMHWGIDYRAPKGTPVSSTADGIVILAQKNDGYGNVIRIDHKNGYESIYAHLNEIDVIPNQEVKRGELIGTVGNSGRTTGNHLHYEILYQSKPINPKIFYSPLSRAYQSRIDIPYTWDETLTKSEDQKFIKTYYASL